VKGRRSWRCPLWSDGLALGEGIGGDQFGSSAALYGSTAVIGAPGYKSGTGAAYVYVNSSGWSQ
jgi:hypothetical protein